MRAASWSTSLVLAFGLFSAVLVGAGPAVAGPEVSTDVVAPYVHLPVSLGSAPGPFTTVFLIRSPRVATVSVTIKCFNQSSQPVGPSSPTVSLAASQTFISAAATTFAPSDLSSSPNFTGIGWCYFSSVDKFSVEVAWGFFPTAALVAGGKITNGNEIELFRSNSSVGLAIANGQTVVAGVIAGTTVIPGVGNVPLWTGGNWLDILILVNPTTVSGQVTVNVFTCAACNPMPAPTPVTVSLPARGLGFVVLSSFATVAFPEGNATITSNSTCCFLGWHWALDPTSHQVVFREVALDRDTTRPLSLADRP
jgi:hypothetical protein